MAGTPAPSIPLISVITTFRNAQAYLDEAIASVVTQTCRQWELLLVDDGSTDRSTEIAQAHAARCPAAIRYLAHPGGVNRGISASRNLGVAHSRGSYLAFLDADDVYLPDKLHRQLRELEARPHIDAVFSTTLLWYSWANDPSAGSRDAPRAIGLLPDRTFEPRQALFSLTTRAALTPATCSVLIRRHAFERIGGFEENFPGMYEDQAFFFKLFLHCRTHMMSGVFDRYRQHAASCCAVAARAGEYHVNGGPSPSRRRFLDWFADYLRNETPTDWRLRCAVEMQRWQQRHPGAARRAHAVTSRAQLLWARCRSRLRRRSRATTVHNPDHVATS